MVEIIKYFFSKKKLRQIEIVHHFWINQKSFTREMRKVLSWHFVKLETELHSGEERYTERYTRWWLRRLLCLVDFYSRYLWIFRFPDGNMGRKIRQQLHISCYLEFLKLHKPEAVVSILWCQVGGGRCHYRSWLNFAIVLLKKNLEHKYFLGQEWGINIIVLPLFP